MPRHTPYRRLSAIKNAAALIAAFNAMNTTNTTSRRPTSLSRLRNAATRRPAGGGNMALSAQFLEINARHRKPPSQAPINPGYSHRTDEAGLKVKRNAHYFAANARAAILAGAFALAGCGGGDTEPTQAEQLDAAGLSAEQRAVAEALIEGFQGETGSDAIGAADVIRAACYAQAVDMPDRFDDIHRRYLANYAAIDQDFYPWFETNAVAMEDAWDIAKRVTQGFEACA